MDTKNWTSEDYENFGRKMAGVMQSMENKTGWDAAKASFEGDFAGELIGSLFTGLFKLGGALLGASANGIKEIGNSIDEWKAAGFEQSEVESLGKVAPLGLREHFARVNAPAVEQAAPSLENVSQLSADNKHGMKDFGQGMFQLHGTTTSTINPTLHDGFAKLEVGPEGANEARNVVLLGGTIIDGADREMRCEIGKDGERSVSIGHRTWDHDQRVSVTLPAIERAQKVEQTVEQSVDPMDMATHDFGTPDAKKMDMATHDFGTPDDAKMDMATFDFSKARESGQKQSQDREQERSRSADEINAGYDFGQVTRAR